MALKIAGRLFTGPVPVTEAVVAPNHQPAVFAVVSKEGDPWDPRFRLVAVGQTGESGTCFASHPDAAQWQGNGPCVGVYLFAVPRDEGGEVEREEIVTDILAQYSPPHAVILK